LIYAVECSFAEPAHEQDWNSFYSGPKLSALISVTGFLTSQRLRLVEGSAPTYLALHTITGSDVLRSDEYFRKGGGNFARWQQWITDWHRNIYDGMDRAPEVDNEHLLLMSTAALTIDVEHEWALAAVDLDRSPEHRHAYLVERGRLDELPANAAAYAAMTPQLQSPPL
jgi:hypothetical protein